MKEAGILNGDIVVIKKTETADNGDIVVALVDDDVATLKKFKKENDNVLLIPFNENYDVQKYLASRVKIQGKLAGLIRKYA